MLALPKLKIGARVHDVLLCILHLTHFPMYYQSHYQLYGITNLYGTNYSSTADLI